MGMREDVASSFAKSESAYVTAKLDDQLFGLPVLSVRDVLAPQRLTRIPLAPAAIAGALNLRGRIVTAITLRKRLGMADSENKDAQINVVVEYEDELYSLLFDEVGDVLPIDVRLIEPKPPTLPDAWAEVTAGVAALDETLAVILDLGILIGGIDFND